MKKTYVIGGVAVLSTTLLAGCFFNDNDDTAAALAPTTTTLTVTPSLGKISKARVVLRNPKANNGEDQVGSVGEAIKDATGKETGSFKISNIPVGLVGPLVLEVQGVNGDGAQNATYFDESLKKDVPFPADKKIRAVIPALIANANVGVTALTELAAQIAFKKAGEGELTQEIAEKANEVIRNNLAPELGTDSLLTPPTVIGNDTIVNEVIKARSAANDYAIKLAAIAQLGSATSPSPMLDALEKLSLDMSADDKIDGINGTSDVEFKFPSGYTSLTSAVNAYLAIYANETRIDTAIYNGTVFNNFGFLNGSMVITISGTGGGTGSGQNCLLSANYLVMGQSLSYSVCYNNFPQNAVCGDGNTAFSATSIPGFNGTANWAFSQVATCPSGSIQVNYLN